MALVGIWTNQGMSSSGWTRAQQQHNATEIWNYFGAQGWTLNAVAAMLGNMEKESFINPAQWEMGFPIEGANDHGFGLVQWTGYKKYTDWAGSDWRTNYAKQLQRIDYEVANNWVQWSNLAAFNYATFYDFTRSTASVDYLTEMFVRCYEKPGNWQGSIAERRGYSNYWYQYLSGVTPPPTPTTLPIWLLFKLKEANGK